MSIRTCALAMFCSLAAFAGPASAQFALPSITPPDARPFPYSAPLEFAGEADEPDEIETDRDSFTPATTNVASGRVLLESAYSFIENRRTANDHSFPEIVTRIGITDRIELRLGWNYEAGGGGSVRGGRGSRHAQHGGHVWEVHELSGQEVASQPSACGWGSRRVGARFGLDPRWPT